MDFEQQQDNEERRRFEEDHDAICDCGDVSTHDLLKADPTTQKRKVDLPISVGRGRTIIWANLIQNLIGGRTIFRLLLTGRLNGLTWQRLLDALCA